MKNVKPHTSKYKLFFWIKRKLLGLGNNKPVKPLFIFTHHKTSTVLMGNVFRKISNDLGLKFCKVYGYCKDVPTGYDIVLFEHSLVSEKVLASDFHGIHIIRDPRDVLVSGYLYHLHTDEEWCTTEPNPTLPINFPYIDFVREHMPDGWKLNYIQSLSRKSYQNNLSSLPKEEGIIFEMEKYTGWTIEDMLSWDYTQPKVLEFKMEEILSDFNNSFKKIISLFGFNSKVSEHCFKRAKEEDINSMSSAKIAKNKHIHSRKVKKWEEHLNEKHLILLENKYPKYLEKLGYGKG